MKVFVVLSCIALALAKPQGYSYNQPSGSLGSSSSGLSAPSFGLSAPGSGKIIHKYITKSIVERHKTHTEY